MRTTLRVALALSTVLLSAACLPPSWGANALLHPSRRPVGAPPALPTATSWSRATASR